MARKKILWAYIAVALVGLGISFYIAKTEFKKNTNYAPKYITEINQEEKI